MKTTYEYWHFAIQVVTEESFAMAGRVASVQSRAEVG